MWGCHGWGVTTGVVCGVLCDAGGFREAVDLDNRKLGQKKWEKKGNTNASHHYILAESYALEGHELTAPWRC